MEQPSGERPSRSPPAHRRRLWPAMAIALAIVVLSPTGVGMRARYTHGGPMAPAPSGPAHPPNVLVFITDDQDVGTWSAMPRTRRLVIDEGIRFRNAYVSNPSCCPSRATILTGDWSHTTGVYTNHGYGGGTRAVPRAGGEKRNPPPHPPPPYESAPPCQNPNRDTPGGDRDG